ncbi:MAG: hypothetical protein NTZ09_19485 [Candidatus Hydrogenedentes bacterium]|nr:hypothetical protein [Candidatus Hydrogenedentota bacterium]
MSGSAPKITSQIAPSLLLLADLAVLSAGLAGLVVAESGLMPGFHQPISANVRIAVGAQGAVLFLVGTLLVVRTGSTPSRRSSQETPLYKLYGLNTPRAGDEFQNFHITTENSNPLQFMWADTVAGSRICPRIDHNSQFLRVEFLNAQNAPPCNIVVRTMGQAPLLNVPRRNYLQFQARVPTCQPKFTRPTAQTFHKDQELPAGAPQRLRRVALSVRLVNGMLQHWAWQGRSQAPRHLVVEGHSWKTFKLPLGEGWARFNTDGNPEGPSKPDFSILSAVAFEIGDEGPPPPSGSYGLVDIRDIRCAD